MSVYVQKQTFIKCDTCDGIASVVNSNGNRFEEEDGEAMRDFATKYGWGKDVPAVGKDQCPKCLGACADGQHEWESHRNPDTPNDPAESVCYCVKCGKEKTE